MFSRCTVLHKHFQNVYCSNLLSHIFPSLTRSVSCTLYHPAVLDCVAQFLTTPSKKEIGIRISFMLALASKNKCSNSFYPFCLKRLAILRFIPVSFHFKCIHNRMNNSLYNSLKTDDTKFCALFPCFSGVFNFITWFYNMSRKLHFTTVFLVCLIAKVSLDPRFPSLTCFKLCKCEVDTNNRITAKCNLNGLNSSALTNIQWPKDLFSL